MKNGSIFLLIILVGCNRPDKKSSNQSPLNKSKTFEAREADSGKIRKESFKADSIRDGIQLKTMLSDVLKIAEKNKHKDHFHQDVDIWNYESITSANIEFGHIFSKDKKHLIVTSKIAASRTYTDIYLYNNSSFNLVLSCLTDDMSYLDTSIRDVNGDGSKDFLIHSYPSSGCCRRNVYDVYLYQSVEGDFSKRYNFINPTFFPDEKIIRGIGYGQPGIVELYKYKWNGRKVDTVEFIMPNTISKRFHVYKHLEDWDNSKSGKYITSVPKEYHNIESYDWFEGKY